MMKIANAQFWVHDQDEALAFYTQTLGWEVRADVTMEAWNFRWLCVGPAGRDDAGLVLMPVPGPPMLSPDDSATLAELVAKGAGGTLFLETDDCQASYDELTARGVTSRINPARCDSPPGRSADPVRLGARARQPGVRVGPWRAPSRGNTGGALRSPSSGCRQNRNRSKMWRARSPW
jgi:catechol 2,3-dioxygenase-like lactoylglutathione lyase family enzyme